MDFTPRNAEKPTGKQIASPYGIAYDEATGYVWVTQTRTSTVSVFDPSTKKVIWTSAEGEADHPREVRIDSATGKAFVSGSGGVTVFDTTSHALLKKIPFTDAKGEEDIAMNLHIDSAGGKVYVPTLSGATLKVINVKTLEVEKTIELHKDNADVTLNPTDVTVDKSLKEIYVSSQGDRKTHVNSGVTVYDLETGSYKKSIAFGQQALAITSDEARDLLYVTDYGTGNVGVIDARTGSVVSEVSTGASSGANDVLVASDGSVYAVARSTEDATTIETNYTIDPATGEYRTSSTEPKGQDGADSPITPGVMVKLDTKIETNTKSADTTCAPAETSKVVAVPSGVTTSYPAGTPLTTSKKEEPTPAPSDSAKPEPSTSAPVPSDSSDSKEIVHEYKDGAKVYFPKSWDGDKLTFRGEGFKTQDGKGSVIAVKLNKGSISAKEEPKLEGVEGSTGVWAYIKADENGNFTATIDRPTVANSSLSEEIKNGDKIAIYLLSGSLTPNDNVRGGVAVEYTFVTAEQTPAPKPDDAKDNPVNPSIPVPSSEAQNPNVQDPSKTQLKDQVKDSSGALRPDSQKGDSSLKNSVSSVQNASSAQNGFSGSTAASKSSNSNSSLAHTGASEVMIATGLGILALVIGAGILVVRRRKA